MPIPSLESKWYSSDITPLANRSVDASASSEQHLGGIMEYSHTCSPYHSKSPLINAGRESLQAQDVMRFMPPPWIIRRFDLGNSLGGFCDGLGLVRPLLL